MEHESKIIWVKRIAYTLVFLAIAAGVWLYEPAKRPAKKKVVKELTSTVAAAPEGPGNKKADEIEIETCVMTTHSGGPNDSTDEEINKLVKTVVSPDKGVAIIHCHLPGDPASEQVADILRAVQQKYGKLIKVIRVGFPAQPADWQAQRGISLPYVIMIVGTENTFQLQGLWPQPKVEKKVEELIFGVRSVGKDWRPAVPGMTHQSH